VVKLVKVVKLEYFNHLNLVFLEELESLTSLEEWLKLNLWVIYLKDGVMFNHFNDFNHFW